MLLKLLVGALVVLIIIGIVIKLGAKYGRVYVGESYSNNSKDHIYETNAKGNYNVYVIKPSNTLAKIKDSNFYKEDIFFLMGFVGFLLLIVGVLIFFNRYNYTKRVDIIEHQRAYVNELNRDVDMIVKTYMEHEKITFDRNVSLQALVITHPELRSVELVQSQLETLKTEKDTLNYLELKILKQRAFIKWVG